MAEKLISPGVLTKEIDQSFLPAALGNIGAAIIGPCVKGPVLVPTIINSPRELEATFGSIFESGSNSYEYFTTLTAKKYLKHKSPITVVRVAGDDYSTAKNSSLTIPELTSSLRQNDELAIDWNDKGAILSSQDPDVIGRGTHNVNYLNGACQATGSFTIADTPANASMSIGSVTFIMTSSFGCANTTNTATTLYVDSGSGITDAAVNFRETINNSSSLHGLQLSASVGPAGTVQLTSSLFGLYQGGSHIARWNGSSTIQSFLYTTSSVDGLESFTSLNEVGGGCDNSTKLTIPFILHSLSEGSILNNQNEVTASGTSYGELVTNGYLTGTGSYQASTDNFRWEIGDVNNLRGTFTLLIRAGNDTEKRKQVLEQWSDLSLDPTQNNYIARVIGNQYHNVAGSSPTQYVQRIGDYPNKSKYVRVEVLTQTPNYLDENGKVRVPEYSASLPSAGSGSQGGGFNGGSDGNIQHPQKLYENIEGTNTQGLNPKVDANGKTAYESAIELLSNQDEYDINLLFMPGLVSAEHGSLITKAIDMCEDRQDTFFVFDSTLYDSSPTTAASQADGYDTSYAATYWPWVQIMDVENKHRWIPPSSAVAEAIAFNDKIAQPWFAPAGLNRGKIAAVQTERKLLESQRNTLYKSNVNPIATFPGQGVCIFGQKTLQKKMSALDRVNVRRLLIKVKKFIASSSRFLLFEQNTPALRKSFLNIAQPFLERVKSQSGLTAFKVVMDASNNTPNTIDRNQLIGQIYLQPTKSAEFIMLDFIIQRTGASFEE